MNVNIPEMAVKSSTFIYYSVIILLITSVCRANTKIHFRVQKSINIYIKDKRNFFFSSNKICINLVNEMMTKIENEFFELIFYG